MCENLGAKSEQLWKVFASAGSIWGDFHIFFATYLTLYSSPLQVMVFILVVFSGPSETHLGVLCSVPNQMEEEVGRKRCILWSFEACDGDAGKDTSGQKVKEQGAKGCAAAVHRSWDRGRRWNNMHGSYASLHHCCYFPSLYLPNALCLS